MIFEPNESLNPAAPPAGFSGLGTGAVEGVPLAPVAAVAAVGVRVVAPPEEGPAGLAVAARGREKSSFRDLSSGSSTEKRRDKGKW